MKKQEEKKPNIPFAAIIVGEGDEAQVVLLRDREDITSDERDALFVELNERVIRDSGKPVEGGEDGETHPTATVALISELSGYSDKTVPQKRTALNNEGWNLTKIPKQGRKAKENDKKANANKMAEIRARLGLEEPKPEESKAENTEESES